jgi:DNA polymerase III epsilon subunit-like protein
MIVVDVETTGLIPSKHGILSIGAVNYDDPTKYFYGEGHPHESVEITQEALDINGFTLEKIRTIEKPISAVLDEFFDWCRAQNTSTVVAGMNARFDLDFINAECERWHITKGWNPFPHQVYDLHTLAHTHYRQWKGFWYHKGMPANFIYERLGLPHEPMPHHALNGAVYEAEAIARLIEGISLFDDFKDYPVKINPWI